MTEERERITVTGLTQQKAGQTAEALEDLLAALEGARRELYDAENRTVTEMVMGARDEVDGIPAPLQEHLLNDLVEALRDVERGGTEKVDEAKKRNDAKTGWKAMQWGDRSE